MARGYEFTVTRSLRLYVDAKAEDIYSIAERAAALVDWNDPEVKSDEKLKRSHSECDVPDNVTAFAAPPDAVSVTSEGRITRSVDSPYSSRLFTAIESWTAHEKWWRIPDGDVVVYDGHALLRASTSAHPATRRVDMPTTGMASVLLSTVHPQPRDRRETYSVFHLLSSIPSRADDGPDIRSVLGRSLDARILRKWLVPLLRVTDTADSANEYIEICVPSAQNQDLPARPGSVIFIAPNWRLAVMPYMGEATAVVV